MAEDVIADLTFLASGDDFDDMLHDGFVVDREGSFVPESFSKFHELEGRIACDRLLMTQDGLWREESFDHNIEEVWTLLEEDCVSNDAFQVLVRCQVGVVDQEVDVKDLLCNGDVRVVRRKFLWCLGSEGVIKLEYHHQTHFCLSHGDLLSLERINLLISSTQKVLNELFDSCKVEEEGLEKLSVLLVFDLVVIGLDSDFAPAGECIPLYHCLKDLSHDLQIFSWDVRQLLARLHPCCEEFAYMGANFKPVGVQ